jgi:hypothetical protein
MGIETEIKDREEVTKITIFPYTTTDVPRSQIPNQGLGKQCQSKASDSTTDLIECKSWVDYT